jgi:hyperosmotically inducible periplasmic protein
MVIKLKSLALVALALGVCTGSFAAQSAADKQNAPDNTKVNKRDKANTEATADQAKNSKSDREIMREIRKSLTSDKTVSSDAHNVKVIAQQGKVTLKGPVRTEEEKATIVAKAKDVAGAGNVTDELEVKPASKQRTH